MYYAVQYRDMHTAIHNLIICRECAVAHAVFDLIEKEETEALQDMFIIHGLQTIEINFRNPPMQYNDEKLNIINQNAVDLYGF